MRWTCPAGVRCLSAVQTTDATLGRSRAPARAAVTAGILAHTVAWDRFAQRLQPIGTRRAAKEAHEARAAAQDPRSGHGRRAYARHRGPGQAAGWAGGALDATANRARRHRCRAPRA